jgi:hypothetical protein
VSAFNHRFTPKDFAGIPMPAAIGAIIAFALGVLTVMLPWVLKPFTLAAALAALAFAVYVLRLGDDWPFRSIMAASRRERGGVTAETWTRV